MLQSQECLSHSFFSSTINSEGKKLNEIMDDIEKEILKQALSKLGSTTAVAKHLKVDRTTIFRKLKKYSLD